MRFKWEEVELEQVCERVNVGFVGTCHKFYTDSDGIKMIRTTNLGDFEIDESDLKYVTIEFHEKNIKSQIKKNDILVARHGDNGKAVRYTSDEPANTLNIVIITPNQNIIHPIFLELLFGSSIIKNQIQQSLVGSVQNVVNTKTIAKLKVPLPTLKEQQFLINILGSLVEKINLNKESIRLLENISSEVFKRWFIDFEFPNEQGLPYRSSGGEMVVSELGEIPLNWYVGKIADICILNSEKVNLEKIEENFNYIGLEHMPQGSIALNEWESSEKVSGVKAKFNKEDILFGKLRPYFKKVGIAPVDGVCSTDILVMRPKNSIEYGFLICQLTQDKFIEYTNSTATGTRMPRSGWNQISNYKIVVPPSDVLESFNQILLPMLKIIQEKIFENNNLKALRDSLLPKLLSGEIENPDESVVES